MARKGDAPFISWVVHPLNDQLWITYIFISSVFFSLAIVVEIGRALTFSLKPDCSNWCSHSKDNVRWRENEESRSPIDDWIPIFCSMKISIWNGSFYIWRIIHIFLPLLLIFFKKDRAQLYRKKKLDNRLSYFGKYQCSK